VIWRKCMKESEAKHNPQDSTYTSMQIKQKLNMVIKNSILLLANTKSALSFELLHVYFWIYERFILWYENIIQILHWKRGKVQRVPADITSFNHQMQGCPDIKRIVENDVKTPITLSDLKIVINLRIYILMLIKIEK